MNLIDSILIGLLAIIGALAFFGPIICWLLLRRRSAGRRSACHVRTPRIGIELPSQRWMVSHDAPGKVRRA